MDGQREELRLCSIFKSVIYWPKYSALLWNRTVQTELGCLVCMLACTKSFITYPFLSDLSLLLSFSLSLSRSLSLSLSLSFSLSRPWPLRRLRSRSLLWLRLRLFLRLWVPRRLRLPLLLRDRRWREWELEEMKGHSLRLKKQLIM